jgi:DNA-binding response OmpR family regulator
MRILVVEDETQVAELIQRMLEQLGNQCLVAPDVEQAERLLGLERVDALTLDLGMPGRGGLDWLEQIANSDPELACKTVVITGMPLEAESVERVARCGAGVLAKPFNLRSLEEAVRTQIAPTRSRDRPDD